MAPMWDAKRQEARARKTLAFGTRTRKRTPPNATIRSMAAKLARSQRTASGSAAYDPGRSALNVGDLLGSKYRVERVLGEGGMGVVVAAYHELLDQRVAVKLLYQDVADSEAQSRLLLEARSTAKLQSEHVARVIDVDVGKDGLPFIVMELLEGADLCQIADSTGALPRWVVVDYILQALEGLAHAHAHSIVHRDLKPSNLFLATRSDGVQVIKILDFGISKSADNVDRRTQQLTGGRSVLGSPPYMSPEQVRSPKTVDARTDIWSLGICMYELLTNSMPFGGDELQETFAQILEKEPTPIRSLISGVPEGLEQIVWKCLAKNREDRFANVGELAKALLPFGSGTWVQSADRVQATLARGVIEDIASGMRVRTSSERIPIPLSPGRRLDSLNPELHGTSSTVRFDAKRRWIVAGIAIPAIIGLGLIVGTAVRRGKQPPVVDDSVAASAAPALSAADPPPPTAVTAPTSPVAESEPPASGAATVPPSSRPPLKGMPFRPSAPAARPVSKSPSSPLPAGLPQTRSGQ
jgi:serine/threonine protein kinase